MTVVKYKNYFIHNRIIWNVYTTIETIDKEMRERELYCNKLKFRKNSKKKQPKTH